MGIININWNSKPATNLIKKIFTEKKVLTSDIKEDLITQATTIPHMNQEGVVYFSTPVPLIDTIAIAGEAIAGAAVAGSENDSQIG